MSKFRVWAPNATRAELIVSGRKLAMEIVGQGWFEADDDKAVPGDDYGYVLDGVGPLPDPRSNWQPEGVDGPSRLVDHDEYTWTDHNWTGRPLGSAIIYELHVGTFTPEGTFSSIIPRLPYLRELGVNAIQLMPVAQFPGSRGWGYDGVDLFAPYDGYGGPDALKRLVDIAHSHGISVILDVVYNHVGPAGNYLNEFGPYFTDHHLTPWGPAVNLDGRDSAPVREFFIDNALMWLRDYHIDGVRLDAVHALFDGSARHFVEELIERVRTLETRVQRTLWVIAETDTNDPRTVRAPELGGYGADAMWSDDFHHALHALLTGESDGYYGDYGYMWQLAKALRETFVYDGRYSVFRARIQGRPVFGTSGHKFLGYMQNHDQIGNRPSGERIAALVTADLVKVGAALVMTAPFAPLLFQGEEWGATSPFLYFTDHQDRDLGRAVTDGRKREFADSGLSPHLIPDPQNVDTFEWSILSWEEQEQEPNADMLEWYKALIRLRKAHDDLSDGRLDRVHTRHDESKKWLVIERGSITIAANFSEDRASIPMTADRTETMLLTSKPAHQTASGTIKLEPQSVTIWKARA